MKETYNQPKTEIIRFETEDIITTSDDIHFPYTPVKE